VRVYRYPASVTQRTWTCRLELPVASRTMRLGVGTSQLVQQQGGSLPANAFAELDSHPGTLPPVSFVFAENLDLSTRVARRFKDDEARSRDEARWEDEGNWRQKTRTLSSCGGAPSRGLDPRALPSWSSSRAAVSRPTGIRLR
jgi:hypothetical protein